MTKRTRRRIYGLLAPRRPKRYMAMATDYGRHLLDLRLEEVMPEGPGRHGMRRRPLIDQPGVRADDEYLLPTKSQLLRNLRVLIDIALARAGALNSDEDEPDLVALCDHAELTLWEYEAVMMRSNGQSWKQIAEGQKVSTRAARAAAERGFRKLADFVLRRD